VHHRFTLSRELQLIQTQYEEFNPHGFGTAQEDKFINLLQNHEGTDGFRPAAAQELLILRAVIANILRNVMDEVAATPFYRGARVSSSYKTKTAGQIADRWDDLAVERYFAAPFAHRGIFARNWLMENATAGRFAAPKNTGQQCTGCQSAENVLIIRCPAMDGNTELYHPCS
jgi:hypothetical protein